MKNIFKILLICTFIFKVSDGHSQCDNPEDYTALRALYLATDGDNWVNHTGWPSAAIFNANPNVLPGTVMSGWFGITCEDSRVTRINLSRNFLRGSLPNFDLPKLTRLDLSENSLSGTIPNFDLPILVDLFLINNGLTGTVPNFDLPNLEILDLSNNGLTGTIPNFDLSNLRFLELYTNGLTGTIPNFDLPNLIFLYLSNNGLSGTIPNFNLPYLTRLLLDHNQLTGTIPNFDMPNFTSLNLSFNQLTGTIPNFDFPNLSTLDLSNNGLTGTIPIDLPQGYKLLINLDVNNLSGCIDPMLFKRICNKKIIISNNPLLPWKGESGPYCGTAQIGAPCDNGNPADGNNDRIQEDCSCAGTTAVFDSEVRHNIRIYPNPSSGILFLEYTETLPERISVINASGEEFKFSISDHKLDLSSLNSGVYTLRGVIDNTSFTKKVVLIR